MLTEKIKDNRTIKLNNNNNNKLKNNKLNNEKCKIIKICKNSDDTNTERLCKKFKVCKNNKINKNNQLELDMFFLDF